MIKNVELKSIKKQKYISLYDIGYDQNGKNRRWEAVEGFDSVATLLYHTKKRAFLLVKQFRPAILLNTKSSINDAYTYELCAGICDKETNLAQTAAEEVAEECGYMVSADKLELITAFYTCVGFSNAHQTLFYAEIDESMKIHNGGGDESESIELVWIEKECALEFALDTDKPKTPGLGLAFYWWFNNKKEKFT